MSADDIHSNDSRIDSRSTPTDTVISWIGWHAVELAGALVPTALAAAVSPWFTVPAALVIGYWIAHEIRIGRQQRSLRAVVDQRAIEVGQITSADDTEESA